MRGGVSQDLHSNTFSMLHKGHRWSSILPRRGIRRRPLLANLLMNCYSELLSFGGPRMKDQLIRPITDVVVTESVIGSLT